MMISNNTAKTPISVGANLPPASGPSLSDGADEHRDEKAVTAPSADHFYKYYMRSFLQDRPHVADTLLVFLVFEIAVVVTEPGVQWQYLGLYGLVTVLLTTVARSPFTFFKGGIADTAADRSSFWLLAASTFISWVFAKSIQNASVLGAKFGIVGGLAYGAYYISFASVATVAYVLRTKYGYLSLQEAIFERYGPIATVSYSLALLFRLYQEVWSNALVVASFYGDYDSAAWWIAAILSTAIPFAYVSLGGLRSSLLTDFVQAILALLLFVVFLSVVKNRANNLSELCVEAGRSHCSLARWDVNPDVKSLSLAGGWDLLLVGLVQGSFSYPFFDPVLTDRAFLAQPKTMFWAFIVGGFVAFWFIFFFAFIGIYGNMSAALDDSIDPDIVADVAIGIPADVARSISTAVFTVTNIIFMTTSISTVDSTFASTAKLSAEMKTFYHTWVPGTLTAVTDEHMRVGRFAIRFIVFLGTLPLLQDPSALDATTVSGTVIMGLGPPIMALLILPRTAQSYYPLAFLSSFWLGVALGFVYQYSDKNPDVLDLSDLTIGDGTYGKLLWFNLVGLASCLGAFVLFAVVEKYTLSMYVSSCYSSVPSINNKTMSIEYDESPDGDVKDETNSDGLEINVDG